MALQAWRDKVAHYKTRLILIAAIVLLVVWMFGDTLGGLFGNHLPSDVEGAITRRYTACIKPDDTPVQYNEPRQPECGRVDIRVVGEGQVPPDEQAAGLTRAICYKVAIQSPYWTTLGTTRHEVKWSARTASKVVVLQNGAWQVFPDEDAADAQRWATFACQEGYESTTGEAP